MSFWKPGTTPIPRLLNANEDERDEGALFFNTVTNIPIEQQRLQLPIAKHRLQILYAVETFRVVCIVGATGCGKSTQVPMFLMESGWTGNRSSDRFYKIICTQPRRIAAITLAKRVAMECGDSNVGQRVGYAVRFDQCFDEQSTEIKYVTDGFLIREAMEDPLLSKYSVVMVDEAHERSLNTDVVLGILKKVRVKRPNLRIIICSATIDAEIFLDYFHTNSATALQSILPSSDSARSREAIISVDGRQYPVDELYVKEPVRDYLKTAVQIAIQIHFEDDAVSSSLGGDILCFLPSAEDIDCAVRMGEEMFQQMSQEQQKGDLQQQKKIKRNKVQLVFLPLYGQLPIQVQARVFQPRKTAEFPHRRAIFATNIAETSVTVPNITHVIDSGFVKLPFFDPKTSLDRLIVCPVSLSGSLQRAGRAGRDRPGKVYRLYTQQHFQSLLPKITPPEVLRTNLSSFVLTLKSLGIDNLTHFDLITSPAVDALSDALAVLYALGALSEDASLTPLGIQMSEFPTDPFCSKMLLSSLKFDCVNDILTIAALSQVQNVFRMPRTRQQEADFNSVQNDIVDYSGDHVTYVKVMALAQGKGEEECEEMFINYSAISLAKEIRKQLRNILLTSSKIEENEVCFPMINEGRRNFSDAEMEKERGKRLRKCVLSGFFFNVARLQSDGHYHTLRGGTLIKLSSSSVLSRYYGENKNEFIVFSETYDSSKGDMEARSCSVVDARWLKEVTPNYWE